MDWNDSPELFNLLLNHILHKNGPTMTSNALVVFAAHIGHAYRGLVKQNGLVYKKIDPEFKPDLSGGFK